MRSEISRASRACSKSRISTSTTRHAHADRRRESDRRHAGPRRRSRAHLRAEGRRLVRRATRRPPGLPPERLGRHRAHHVRRVDRACLGVPALSRDGPAAERVATSSAITSGSSEPLEIRGRAHCLMQADLERYPGAKSAREAARRAPLRSGPGGSHDARVGVSPRSCEPCALARSSASSATSSSRRARSSGDHERVVSGCRNDRQRRRHGRAPTRGTSTCCSRRRACAPSSWRRIRGSRALRGDGERERRRCHGGGPGRSSTSCSWVAETTRACSTG